MAGLSSSLHSQFGTSSLRIKHPKAPSAHKRHHSNFVGNFLGDLRSAAVGIPMGLITLGKSTYHDASSGAFWSEYLHGDIHKAVHGTELWKNVVEPSVNSYKDTYGHGWGHFAHSFHQHPLGPVLDAVSVATLPFGGLGAGIKAGTATAELGARVAGEGSLLARVAARSRSFSDAHFEKQTRTLTALGKGTPVGYKHYSQNPSTRMMQRGLERFNDLTRVRSDAKRHQSWLDQELSKHGQAESATQAAAAKRFVKLLKKGHGVDDIAHSLDDPIYENFVNHALRVPAGKRGGVPKLSGEFQLVPKPHARGITEMPSDIAKRLGLSEDDPRVVGTWLKNLGHRLAPRGIKPIDAARAPNGDYLVVHKPSMVSALKKVGDMHPALHALYHSPTKVWKWMVLATAPRYFVNNVVGNNLMLLAGHNPYQISRSMYASIKDAHGERAARRAMSEVDAEVSRVTGAGPHGWQTRHFSRAHQGFAGEVTRDMKLHERFGNPVVRKGVKIGTQGLYGVTHVVSDTWPRKIAVDAAMRKHPMYKTLKRDGYSHAEAADMAARAPSVRDWVEKTASNTLGQYHHFNKLERGIKSVVPFYSWDRAIMRHTGAMVRDRPAEAAALAQLGTQGSEETKKKLGAIPDFLQGAIPIGGKYAGGVAGLILGTDRSGEGRKKVITTQGLNPYATVPDVIEAGASLVTGGPRVNESIAGQVNPLITGAVEHVTGQSLLSGRKITRHGGLFTDVAYRTSENTPAGQILRAIISGRPHPKVDTHGNVRSPLLYRGDTHQVVSSLMGLPVRDVSTQKAGELYRKEQGITLARSGGRRKKVDLRGFYSTSSRSSGGRHRTHTRRLTRRRRKSVRSLMASSHVKNTLPKIHF